MCSVIAKSNVCGNLQTVDAIGMSNFDFYENITYNISTIFGKTYCFIKIKYLHSSGLKTNIP